MAHTVCPLVCGWDRQRLATVVADRNQPQKHGRGHGSSGLGRAAGRGGGGPAGRAEPAGGLALAAALRRGRRRRAVRDKTRNPGEPATPARVVRRWRLTCAEPPARRPMNRPDDGPAAGLSLRTVQRSGRPTGCGPTAAPSGAAATESSPSSRTSLPGAATACGRAVGGREKPDPGRRSTRRPCPSSPARPGR